MNDIKQQRKIGYYTAKETLADRRKLSDDVYEAICAVLMAPVREIEQEVYTQLLTITDEETASILCDKVEDSYTRPDVHVPYYIQAYVEAAEKELEEAKSLYIEVLDDPEEEEVDFHNEFCFNMDSSYPNDGYLDQVKPELWLEDIT